MSSFDPSWLGVLFLAALGLFVGFLLRGVIWRVPRGLGILPPHGASRERVPRRYPLVEVGVGAAFALIGWGVVVGRYPAPLLPVLLYWAAVGIALTLIDLDHHRLPNVIVVPSYLVTAVLLVVASALTGEFQRLLTAAIGGAGLFAFYWILAMAPGAGMGFGDVKLAGAVGLLLGWFGWQPLIVGAFSAFLIGGLVALLLMLSRRATRSSRIAFGPFLLLGAAAGVLVGAGS